MDIKKIVEEYQNNTSFDFNDYLTNFSRQRTGGSINKTPEERKKYYDNKVKKNNPNTVRNTQKKPEDKTDNSEKPVINNSNNNTNLHNNNEEKKFTYNKGTSNTQLKNQIRNLQNPKELGQLVSEMRKAGEKKEKIDLVLNRGKSQFNINNPTKKEVANKNESSLKEKIEQKSENANNANNNGYPPRKDNENKEKDEKKELLKQNINKAKVEERHNRKVNNVIAQYENTTPEKREEYKKLLEEQLANGNLTANGKAVREKALAEIKNSDEKLRAKKDIDELLSKGDKKNAEFLINRYEERTGKKLGYNLTKNNNGTDDQKQEPNDKTKNNPKDEKTYNQILDDFKNIKTQEDRDAYLSSLRQQLPGIEDPKVRDATIKALNEYTNNQNNKTGVEEGKKLEAPLKNNESYVHNLDTKNEKKDNNENNTKNTEEQNNAQEGTQNQNNAVNAMGQTWGNGNKNNNKTNTNDDDDEDKPSGFINKINYDADKKTNEIAEKAKKGQLTKEDNEFLANQMQNEGMASFFKRTQKEAKDAYDKSMGLGKTMALAGAVFGAMAEHKRRLRQWEADYQYAVANGMPPPRKPGFFGSMVMGGTKGAALGATGAFLAKKTGMGKSLHNTIKDFTGNMAVQNRMNSRIGKFKRKTLSEEDYKNAKTYKNLKTDEERKHFIHEVTTNKINKAINDIKDGKRIYRNDYEFIRDNYNDLYNSGYLKKLQDELGATNKDELWEKIKDNKESRFWGGPKNFSEDLEEMSFSEQLEYSNYLSVCFSLSAKIEENAKVELEELENYYNAFHNIFPELEMDVKEFLTECVLFPDFLKFVKKVTKDEKMLEYIQIRDQNFSERINNIIKFKQEAILENEKLYNNYCSLFNKEPNKDKFLDMLKRYDEFKAYIIEKIANTKLLNFSLGTVKMPENVDIESDINNAPVLPQGASQESLSKISENTQKTQNSLNSKDMAEKEKKKELEQQAKEKEKKIEFQNKKEAFTKEQNGKLQEKLQNLTAKKSELQNKLTNNRQNMPVEKISQIGDKITGLNLKMQQARKDTKAKIEGFGAKKK